ncbi:MAG: type II toxin-antitoxin system VapC family toxin [Desulfobulbaceae bacterium]|nr:type II toxin-antitoxin system VapC family toxin [Desulfobulbaceae bacterium]
MYYLDTSVLAAYYCPEPLSAKVEKLVLEYPTPAISHLTELELVSAIARNIREKSLSHAAGHKIINLFQSHLDHNLYRWVAIDHHHYRKALSWVSQFNTPLRTLDALHLAIAATENVVLITADRQLAQAAKFYGIDFILVK